MSRPVRCVVLFLAIPFLFVQLLHAQAAESPAPDPRFKADILLVVAHPDDESIIAGYLARAEFDEHKNVAVVFTTRGDAGQNLVGNEQARTLAEVREMEARDALAFIGIHNVWFLRGPDTPYPDVPDVLRSLETWNHGKVLGELVRFIRLTRPGVVITMLPDVVVGENHEDHQAAGVVTTEAFDLAGDPTWFPEQLGAPEDRLWFANLMEGLTVWQPKKLYFFTDASHTDFLRGRGPEYSMTEISPSQHLSYARLTAKEIAFHKTQYDGGPDRDLATGTLHFYEQPLTFILGKSLVPASVTGDIFEGIVPGPMDFSPVRGFRGGKGIEGGNGKFWIELGGGWAFYKRFWPAHNLDSLPGLLAPELGVGSGQDFPVPIVLHNDGEVDVVVSLHPHLPSGWSVDSASAQYAHHPMPQHSFRVAAHSAVSLRMRVVAPLLKTPTWQEVTWTADVEGRSAGSATLRVFIEAE